MSDKWESKPGLYPKNKEFIGDKPTRYRLKGNIPPIFWVAIITIVLCISGIIAITLIGFTYD